MASSASSTRYLRGRKRVLHKDDIPLDNNNIFNENNNNEGIDIKTYNNAGGEQQSPKIQSNEKQNYNNNKSTWDLGNLSPSILFAEAAVVTLIVGAYTENVLMVLVYCCVYFANSLLTSYAHFYTFS